MRNRDFDKLVEMRTMQLRGEARAAMGLRVLPPPPLALDAIWISWSRSDFLPSLIQARRSSGVWGVPGIQIAFIR